ncbi:hypothetical protein NMY22_g2594 [Coprinellus aureogranulatus]|nr:hypothetical protein NMY22_g2594 [Coprinellus aureogranulatus]
MFKNPRAPSERSFYKSKEGLEAQDHPKEHSLPSDDPKVNRRLPSPSSPTANQAMPSATYYQIPSSGEQTPPFQRRPAHKRTWSFYSTASSSTNSSHGGRSSPSLLNPLPNALTGVGDVKSENAWGAFVPPSQSYMGIGATNSLMRFIPASSASAASHGRHRRGGTRPVMPSHAAHDIDNRRKDIEKVRSPLSSRADIPVPMIVRTTPSTSSSTTASSASSSRSPSPHRSRDSPLDLSPTSLLHPEITYGGLGSGLHPVLARAERSSKFCKGVKVCATCSKTGRDFPACGKCNKMWCSRECRLAGGKRHVC